MNSREILAAILDLDYTEEEWATFDVDEELRKTSFPTREKFLNKMGDVWVENAVIHWWQHVYTPSFDGDYHVYKSWNGQINRFKHISVGGYLPESEQNCVTFIGYKNEDVLKQVEELSKWIPHITPITNKKGEKYKFVKILEHRLSKDGVYFMAIYENNKYSVEYYRYSRHYVDREFDSLTDCVKYICEKLYYQKSFKD